MVTAGDNPIKNPEEDVLGRTLLARDLAQELRHLDVSEGSVVAIMGPWGSGKTSLVNLIKRELVAEPSVPVLDFNPWMFSGSEQLVESFFVELAAQLRIKAKRLTKIADEFAAYGDLLSPLGVIPIIGPWLTRFRSAGAALKTFQDRRKESVTERRQKLSSKLTELDEPVVVVVDDIDRLNIGEIRDIFKLVRLTASFPNIIYLLAFDRGRVEDALTESRFDGRSYLEKIVQLPIDLPEVPDRILVSQVTTTLDQALSGFDGDALFDESRWPDVLAEIIFPLIRNMRDVRRYAASVRTTARGLNGQIELVDLLGLEAVRIFLPDVFTAMTRAEVALTKVGGIISGSGGANQTLKRDIELLIEAAGQNRQIVEAMIGRIFPAAQSYVGNTHHGGEWLGTWLKARRVAHGDILRLYLERVANEGTLAFNDAERAFLLLAPDAAELNRFLRSIAPERLEDVIATLEIYQDDYPINAVPGAITVLLNLLPELPHRQRGFALGDSRIVVTRVVLRMLRRLDNADEVERVVRQVQSAIMALSARLELLLLVGHVEHAGHKLVSETADETMSSDLIEAILNHPPEELARERSLLMILLWLRDKAPDGHAIDRLLANPLLVAAVLLDAWAEVQGQQIGSRSVTRTPRLQWDALVKIFGGEDSVKQAVELVESDVEEGSKLAETLGIARQYLDGWRPTRF